MPLDPAVIALLPDIDPSSKTSLTSGNSGCSSARTSKITVENADGSKRHYFLKSGTGRSAEIMFRGEHASLTALSNAVPGICPRSFGHGKYRQDPITAFLVTEFLDTSASTTSSSPSRKHATLAQKLAKLHTMPAPVPDGYDTRQFGFPETTCCGDTPQDNSYESSWMAFYQNRRLRFILKQSESNQGADAELRDVIERTCEEVVPRLLSDQHLNSGKAITPVVVHGDLWSGNAARGRLSSSTDSAEDVIFDSSACYAHSEYELGIMKMFGGFGESFLKEYHSLVPKTEPAEEYADRVRLYEVYHHLNHYAMFGGGYRSGAMSILKELLGKYGKQMS